MMDLNRWSKSADTMWSMCRYAFDQFRNHGIEQIKGAAATNAIEGHLLKAACSLGQKTYEECLRSCSNDDVAELFQLALQNDLTWDNRHFYEYERRFNFNTKGKIIKGWKGCEVSCILDQIGLIGDLVHVIDLKFNKPGWESDYPRERNAYIMAARKAYPRCRLFRFSYFYARTGTWTNWDYRYVKRSRVEVTGPNGEREIYQTERGDPFWNDIIERLALIRASEPIPTPGAHCESWFGHPCQFLGNGCPFGDRLPDLIKATRAPIENPITLEGLSPAEQTWTAFMAILRGDVTREQITPDIASAAYPGVMQMAEAAKKVQGILRKWSRTNGPIRVGDTEYSYVTTIKPGIPDDRLIMALKMLHGAGGWEAVARAINLSSSSLKGLGVRTYGDLKDSILQVCGDQITKEEWKGVKV